jgi:hypothetical protein
MHPRGPAGRSPAVNRRAIQRHAGLADLPVDEIIPIADTVIVREDPVSAG